MVHRYWRLHSRRKRDLYLLYDKPIHNNFVECPHFCRVTVSMFHKSNSLPIIFIFPRAVHHDSKKESLFELLVEQTEKTLFVVYSPVESPFCSFAECFLILVAPRNSVHTTNESILARLC